MSFVCFGARPLRIMKVRSIVKQSHEAVPMKQQLTAAKKNHLLVHETPFPERPEKKIRKQKKRGVCEESFSEAMCDVHFNTGRSVCDTLLKNPAGSLCNVRNMVSQFDEAGTFQGAVADEGR